MERILKIFSPEDEADLKQTLKSIIKDQFEADLKAHNTYMFDYIDIEDTVTEAFQEVIYEVRQEYKQILMEKMLLLMEKDVEKILQARETKGT